nr:uncharacterized protein PB1E7.01C-like [Ipomoea batatas]
MKNTVEELQLHAQRKESRRVKDLPQLSRPQSTAALARVVTPRLHRYLATIAMTTEETSKNNKRPQVVKLDRALKLAEQWVTNMGKSSDDDKPNGAILESRPLLVPRESKHVRSNDPIERKLRATLNAKERKAERRADERGNICQ